MLRKHFRFTVLILLVTISGFTQGMLLPLIAVILEQSGISSSINGLHATGLYIGVLIASPFMEKPIRNIGYKPMIMLGGALVFISLLFFPFWESLWFWFMLRVTIGIGDHMLHFGTQTWITSTSPENKRGRNIALYGVFFGLGFTLGPLMTRLVSIHISLPFLLSAAFSVIVWSLMFLVRNEIPEEDEEYSTSSNSFKRFAKAWQYAWVAFLPPLGYGFLEATLHGNFPVYGMRIGHDVDTLSLIIPTFAAGSLISQLPLGILSDRIGWKKVLVSVMLAGIVCFGLASFYEQSVTWLIILFTLAGIFVGSIFSLGISYMTDILPKSLLPAGNIMCGISFSVGSIIGPYLGGVYIDLFPDASFFHVITTMLIILVIPILLKKEKPPHNQKSLSPAQ
ncbi:MFS transporter [Pontibacillus yanchengensis]|uniref:MFS transporter n=1 Tax=Pontibacillus yanchengensis TaxID=462910 RepID=A0A6I5A259_9BACI|nr:MFS transporter [Pontibacillus yanchengensis]MYL34860.1 MFS transporter [Pontibacillus yanchengensis]